MPTLENEGGHLLTLWFYYENENVRVKPSN